MNHYIETLIYVRFNPVKFQADFARSHARHIAEAASRGHITCVTNGVNRGNWMLSNKGVSFLSHNGVNV